MKTITLAKSGLNKIRSFQRELKNSDVEDSIKSLSPGEWCLFQHVTADSVWVGFVNPIIDEKYSTMQIVEQLSKSESIKFDIEKFIELKITESYMKRLRFKGYEKGSRIFYGQNDGLPGLIVDSFHNTAVIQINTAGLDRYRDFIKSIVNKCLKGQSVFLDNAKYRQKESLPTYETEKLPSLQIEENNITYHIRPEVLQKVGFYYDHRENRNLLVGLLTRLVKIPSKGIDLFSYVGAWGLNALKAGVENMVFVDQGDFENEINLNLNENQLSNRGYFTRADVFKYLDEKISVEEKFDLVICDPPAFAKSALQKNQALDGYSKLHRKVFKISEPGAVIAFSSCTHYVSHEEFQRNILDAAKKENKKIQLLISGIQGWDHPVPSLEDKSNYIKCYMYLME